MGGNALAISASAGNAPPIETRRLSCTLSILVVSRPKEVILRERIVVEVPLRDFAHIGYRCSPVFSSRSGVLPEEGGIVDDAGSARSDHPQTGSKIGCTREAQVWGERRDSGAGTRRLEADTANGGLVVDGGGALSLAAGGGRVAVVRS
jgi:hypothetical protein